MEAVGDANPHTGCRRMRHAPELIEVDNTQLDDVLRRVEHSLDEKDAALIRAVFESYAYVTELVEDKNTSIRRLRHLFFGSRSEKTEAVVGPNAEPSGGSSPGDDAADRVLKAADIASTEKSNESTSVKGHGRNGADAYGGAARVDVRHGSLMAGDACPACQQGTVYDKAPGVVIRITGTPPLSATIYELQKLRCHVCGEVFTADTPAEAGDQKYDATAGSMIGLLKYGSGLPFNRLDSLQGNLDVPLPASTQWEIVKAVATNLAPVFAELVRQAAQGELLHNDDTTVKILELMGKRAQKAASPAGAATPEPDVSDSRRGIFTSGVVALRDGHRIALFFSGRLHAGENLAQILKQRASELPPPIQMCDALSSNLPGELRTILANCLAHARRQFVDIYDRFPRPCRHLLETLAVVYRNDARARTDQLSPEARLKFHQEASGPAMEQLHTWLNQQLADKLVEPNSALGSAIGYMLRHWNKLTLFLRQAGAPLDNNVCERALKKAILHRKNALFYKTRNGAKVGDLFMSLIYTCQLNNANPFDYLTELQRHAQSLAANPDRWMPWHYRDALA
jgi:transposase